MAFFAADQGISQLLGDIKEDTNWYNLLAYLISDSDTSWKDYEDELIKE